MTELIILASCYLGPWENNHCEVRSFGAEKLIRYLDSICPQPVTPCIVSDACQETIDVCEQYNQDHEHTTLYLHLKTSPNDTESYRLRIGGKDLRVRQRVDYGNAALNFGLGCLRKIHSGDCWVGYASPDDMIEPGFYADLLEKLDKVSTEWAWTDTGRKSPRSRVQEGVYLITGADIYHRLRSSCEWKGRDGERHGYGHDHIYANQLAREYGPPERIEIWDGYKVMHVPTAFDT